MEDAIARLANAPSLDYGDRQYTMVQDRVEVFRLVFGEEFSIRTKILSLPPYKPGHVFIMKCEITKDENILATGHAMEIMGKGEINQTAFVENCETSAIGRALAAFGLHGGEYASGNEMNNIPRKRQARDSLETDVTNPGHASGEATEEEAEQRQTTPVGLG